MSSSFNNNRNGLSQSQRSIEALGPDYFLLDERSIADLIAHAQNYAEVLHYFNLDDRIDGAKPDWSAFLDGDPQEMVDFLNAPDIFDAFPEKKAKYSRPHLVLFLVFLQLLQDSNAEINNLTKKQMDFYYRQALRFTTKKGAADRVHVLANIADAGTEVLIPKGTLLQGGVDGQGNPVEYATDRDLIANHARIARLMSQFVEKEVIDIPGLRIQGENAPDGGFLSILELTYRKIGTANTPRNYPDDKNTDRKLDQALIDELDVLENTIIKWFQLTVEKHRAIPSFQRLLQQFHYWENENLWNSINKFLLTTYNAVKNKNAKEADVFPDPKDFDVNFKTALGFTVDGDKDDGSNVFKGIPDVNNLYDLYDNHLRFPNDEKILKFISDNFKQEPAQFRDFMNFRNQTLGLIKNINQQLKTAAKNAALTFEPWDDFHYKKDGTLAIYFVHYLGADGVNSDQDLVNYEQKLDEIERYFKMSAGDYFFVRSLYLPENRAKVPAWELEKADALLIEAYRTLNSAASAEEALFPEIIRWKNVYAAPDTTLLQFKSSSETEPFSRWKAFGAQPPAKPDTEIQYAADIGFAVSSPSLSLSEGVRELTLKFTFADGEFDNQRETLEQYFKEIDPAKGPYPFHIEASTPEGWARFPVWTSFQIVKDEPAIKIVVTAKEDVKPFATLEGDASPFPSLRLILNKDAFFSDENIQVYELFKDQFLKQFDLGIKVTGLKNLLIQTKDGGADAQKPFDIFGTVPELGDRLYITHPELASQELDSLTVNFEWKNLPTEGLKTYYQAYGKPDTNDDSFQAQFSLVEAFQRLDFNPKQQSLFPAAGKTSQTILSGKLPGKFSNTGNPYTRKPFAKTVSEVIDSDRYLEIELKRDFLHSQYPAIVQKLANDSLEKSSKDGKYTAPPILNEPYKPTVKSIRIDYETSLTIDLKTDKSSGEDKAAHIEAFGFYYLFGNQAGVAFLPEVEKEGTLFVGLEALNPPENVSFLFQLAEGSADPNLEPSPIAWSYLSGNEWKELKKDLLTDTTGGLLNSGLIEIHVPADASFQHQRMPTGLHWLRAEVDRFTESLSDAIDIRTQGVSATWLDPGRASDHLEQPLKAETISQPAEPIAGLSSFSQPYSSFLGKAAEGDDQLYRRASAVLRHKRRALTIWDYENLVLEEFPDIFRAKAITADVWGDDYEPGNVRIIVIPDIRQRKPFDPFEPRVPVYRIREIEEFLQKRAPAFARIRVQNARFMYLQLRIWVRFNDMSNFGFYAGKLHQELLEYLAPWAFDKSVDVMFGGKIYPSVIVDFIENRTYVDYIDKPVLQLQEQKSDGSFQEVKGQGNEDYLYIDEPDVVVVSAHQHYIEEYILLPETSERIRQGIGIAKIEFDFRVQTTS